MEGYCQREESVSLLFIRLETSFHPGLIIHWINHPSLYWKYYQSLHGENIKYLQSEIKKKGAKNRNCSLKKNLECHVASLQNNPTLIHQRREFGTRMKVRNPSIDSRNDYIYPSIGNNRDSSFREIFIKILPTILYNCYS